VDDLKKDADALYTMDQMREYADNFHLSRMRVMVAEKEAYERHTPPSALREAVDLTIKTLERQLDLIDERAPGIYLDKMPVIRSLRAHKQRLERAIGQAKEPT